MNNPKKRKVAILSVSAGAGHLRAAEALKGYAQKYYPGVEAVHLDVMDFVPRLFRKVYAESYVKLVKAHPALWGYLYDKTDRDRGDTRLERFRQVLQKLSALDLRRKLRELDPVAVICTHFLPAELIAREIRRGRFTKPVWVVVTDFDVHHLWIHEEMAGYFVASDEVAVRLKDRGKSTDSLVRVTGIPIAPVFAKRLGKERMLLEQKLKPGKPTLLLMAGGFGMGKIDALAGELAASNKSLQIIALAGKNKDLLKSLKTVSRKHKGRIKPMGFTDKVERLMSASDLVVTKPGGLTTSECLAMGLPMVIVDPIPGQEERNTDYLLENGAAVKAYDAPLLIHKVEKLLNNKAKLTAMGKNAKALGRPFAAREILRVVLKG